MATTDLKLDEAGSLPRPGPVGRLVRLALGLLCLWYVMGLIDMSASLITTDGHIRAVVWNGILIGLFLISYIVNIGFSRAWKKWPALVSAGVFLLVGGVGYLTEGTVETNLLARTIWVWELYLFSHLGTAFLIAAVLGTPGCEMRAFHDLYSRLTGIPTKEHHCPIGPLTPVDRWEADRSKLDH
tara:strand:+ start:12475 stop:13026 length:552 start_codon:yes stop_codon:yes gene_type:complete